MDAIMCKKITLPIYSFSAKICDDVLKKTSQKNELMLMMPAMPIMYSSRSGFAVSSS